MMTTVLTRGADWGLCFDWGDCGKGADIDATSDLLHGMVVATFHELCAESRLDVTWLPATSEVIGPVTLADEPDIDDTLARIREEAFAAVGDEWTNGDIEPVMKGGE